MNFNSAAWLDGALRLKHPHTTYTNPPKHHLTRFACTTYLHTPNKNSLAEQTDADIYLYIYIYIILFDYIFLMGRHVLFILRAA